MASGFKQVMKKALLTEYSSIFCISTVRLEAVSHFLAAK
jgi:hypothetical protein